MWPHWPHDLWCQRWPFGTSFGRPYFVGTSTTGTPSGTRCTTSSPSASSRNSSSWKSAGTVSGSRSNRSFFFSITSTGIGISPPSGVVATGSCRRVAPGALGSSSLDPLLLQALLHDLLEDHVQAFVDVTDHVERTGLEPDQVQLDQGPFGHVPTGRRRVEGLGRERAAPERELVRDVGYLGPPVREGVRLQHVRGDLRPGRHDLVD